MNERAKLLERISFSPSNFSWVNIFLTQVITLEYQVIVPTKQEGGRNNNYLLRSKDEGQPRMVSVVNHNGGVEMNRRRLNPLPITLCR